ncbi:MAG: hypothetical protein GWP70_12080 [Proteobacteria bacterium]|nr:hypothetical protein [Pseudomonadota bacterium]
MDAYLAPWIKWCRQTFASKRTLLAGFALKRQVVAAYNQLIGAKRQSFRKKAAKKAIICQLFGKTLPTCGKSVPGASA